MTTTPFRRPDQAPPRGRSGIDSTPRIATARGTSDVDKRDCTVRYVRSGRTIAVATIYRDLDSLQAELEMERRIRE